MKGVVAEQIRAPNSSSSVSVPPRGKWVPVRTEKALVIDLA